MHFYNSDRVALVIDNANLSAAKSQRRGTQRPWPLLALGQDPNSLPALIAYHLHRLHLTGAPLRASGYYKRYKLPLLTQARCPMSLRDAERLADALRIPVVELTRRLTSEEAAEWSYYRVAARHPRVVWAKAQTAWRAAGLRDTEAAEIMDMDRTAVSRNVSRRRKVPARVLSYPAALKLARALNLRTGPSAFLPDRDT